MRKLEVSSIIPKIESMCIEANYNASSSLMTTLRQAQENESSTLGQTILSQIIKNDEIATNSQEPMCQDTGIVLEFVQIGSSIQLIGNLEEAIHEGIRRGYQNGYLRKSVVAHPLDRINTKDNTPAIIHYQWVEGDELKITIAPKGAGSENVSAVGMLKPSDGYEGVKQLVHRLLSESGLVGILKNVPYSLSKH